LRVRGRKRERVLRVLLNEPGGSLTKYGIAKLSECSREWVIEFLRKLEAQGLVKQTRVLDYGGLIGFWSGVRSEPEHWDYMLREPLEFLRKMELSYALTTYQGENLLQRYLFPSRTDFYICEEDREEWHRRIAAGGGLVGKGNLRILVTDRHVFYNATRRQGLTVVSVPQLIVDLLSEGGPCVEAAQLLVEKVKSRAIPAA